jgi:hypothetical protein
MKMSAYYMAIFCIWTALILTLISRLTSADIVPYGEVIAIIGSLISIRKMSGDGPLHLGKGLCFQAYGPRPMGRSTLASSPREAPRKGLCLSTDDRSRSERWSSREAGTPTPRDRSSLDEEISNADRIKSQIGNVKYGTLRHSIRQLIIQMGLWVILRFEQLKSRLEWRRSNVKYRIIDNRQYTEIAIDDGSRQTTIHLPMIRGRYNIKISGFPTVIPYPIGFSNGYTWFIPVKPQMLGYRKFEVEIDDFDHSSQRFEIPIDRFIDLYDIVEKYKHYIQTTSLSSNLAEAYD